MCVCVTKNNYNENSHTSPTKAVKYHPFQTGVDVIHLPCSTRLWISTNFDSAAVSTSSSYILLHKCRKTCTLLYMRSMISPPKKGFTENALSYFRSKRSMCHVHVSMSRLRVLS